MATLAPSCASSSAIARPIPRDAPVTSAALPSNRPIFLSPRWEEIQENRVFPTRTSILDAMVLNPLKNRRDTLSTADAHGHQGAFAADPFQLIERFNGQDAAGSTDGVSQRNTAAIGVGAIRWQFQ